MVDWMLKMRQLLLKLLERKKSRSTNAAYLVEEVEDRVGLYVSLMALIF